VTAEAERGEGDQRLGGLEPVRDFGDQADLGVRAAVDRASRATTDLSASLTDVKRYATAIPPRAAHRRDTLGQRPEEP
jgi:hypothetical protein